MKNVIVKKSCIEGKGVFAARNFKKGEVVISWDISNVLTKDEIRKLPEKEKRYVSHLSGKYILMQPPARYVNHSCNPNTHAKNFCDIAMRNIRKGEEITSDYSVDLAHDFEMKCKCGSIKCRKIIKRR